MSKIMAVPAEHLKHLPTDILITDPSVIQLVCDVIKTQHCYRERAELEEDPAWRQPIPYVLVTNAVGTIVLMQRMKGQGETRLAGKYYLGAGGHVEDGHKVFYTALKEVTEELALPLQALHLRGVLITTGGPVEDVHLCLFYRATTIYEAFGSPEAALHEARWATVAEIAVKVPDMEKWSQVIARDFLGIK